MTSEKVICRYWLVCRLSPELRWCWHSKPHPEHKSGRPLTSSSMQSALRLDCTKNRCYYYPFGTCVEIEGDESVDHE